MTNKNILGPTSRDSTEWNHAWEVLRRLAAARRNALHELNEADPALPICGPTSEPSPALTEPGPSALTESGQYARAIAEIEQASAALRRAEPALEAWLPEGEPVPDVAAQREARYSRSVWILVGGIWISTVLVMAGAIGATLLVLG
jgi:nucleotide-binding universal stress UspA family protein